MNTHKTNDFGEYSVRKTIDLSGEVPTEPGVEEDRQTYIVNSSIMKHTVMTLSAIIVLLVSFIGFMSARDMGIQKKFESIKKSEENIQTCFSGVITEAANIQKQIKELSDKNNIVTSSKFIKAKCSK